MDKFFPYDSKPISNYDAFSPCVEFHGSNNAIALQLPNWPLKGKYCSKLTYEYDAKDQ